MASTVVAAPSFAEAELVIECRKIFRQPMTPEAMLDPRAVAAYPTRDYHIIYIGEVVAVRRE
jgi:flavin reductase (DIM6/NTAB) family NADH-FMN oxidoreductase RutF